MSDDGGQSWLDTQGSVRMPQVIIVYGARLMMLSVILLVHGCSGACQRCATDRPADRAGTTIPSRAVQELLAQRTWAALVEQRAAHEARALQVAAIDAEHDRVIHLPRVSLQVGTPIPLATAMQMLVAETGYSVVYGDGVDPHQPVSSSLVHQRLDAASDALVQPLGYTARLHTRDRQIHIASLMTAHWRLPPVEKDEAWWDAARTRLDEVLAAGAATATASGGSAPLMVPANGTVMIDHTTRLIAVSAPIPRLAVIDAYLSGLGAERLDMQEE
jgi:hypothetical protein